MSNGAQVQAAIQVSGSSRERLRKTLRHETPDRIPIDFGGSAVTGVHASCVAALRDYYGLEKRPVRVHEPFQMLALIDEDLRAAMGVDVTGVFSHSTMFGFPIERWKSWNFNGLEVLVPGDFNTITDEKGDTLIYPEGDRSVPPSGRMPQGGYFFDSIIRQEPFDEEKLNPEDNLEEFQPISQADLDHLARAAREAAATGAGVLAGFGGTALRRHCLGSGAVPQASQRHSRHDGVVRIDAQPPGLHPQDFRAPVRDRDRESGADLCRRRRPGAGGVHLRHRFRHANFGVLLRKDVAGSLFPVLQAGERLDSRAHAVENVQA